jgi:hypothetical protein
VRKQPKSSKLKSVPELAACRCCKLSREGPGYDAAQIAAINTVLGAAAIKEFRDVLDMLQSSSFAP